MRVWFWRLGALLIMGVILVNIYDYWTEPPATLFEQLLGDTVIPRHKLEENILSLLDRGYSCDEILQTIAEVRWFVREQFLKLPSEEAKLLLASRLAKEREKRIKEAEKHPDVYHGGLTWLRFRKSLFGYRPKESSPCPRGIRQTKTNGGKE